MSPEYSRSQLYPLVLAEPDRPFWGFAELFLAASIFFVGGGGVFSLALYFLHDAAKTGPWGVVETLASFLIVFAAIKIMFLFQKRPLLSSLGWVRQPFNPLSLVFMGFGLVFVTLMLQILLRTPDVQTPFSKLLESGLASRIAMAVYGVTAGPVIEELLFRGFIQPVLVNATGVFPGILATSALFGAMHVVQYGGLWQAGVTITVAGFGFGVVRHVSGSTRASALVHIAYNSLPFLLTFLFAYQK